MAKANGVADVLKQLRNDAGYTQAQIAELLNIHRTTYTKYEKDHTPGVEVFVRLAEIYNMAVDDILSMADERYVSSKVRLGAPAQSDSKQAEPIRLSEDEFRLLSIYRESSCKKKIIDAARRLSSEADLDKKD